MKDKDAFLKAAKIVDSGKEDYSCWAVLMALDVPWTFDVGTDNSCPTLSKYVQTFNGTKPFDHFAARVLNAIPHKDLAEEQDLKEFRVLMLLFMAEACEDL